MPKLRSRAAFAIVVVTVAGLVVPTIAAAGVTTKAALRWSSCSDGFECATLRVPLDDAKPKGRKITLALVRVRARNPERRIGSLVINPGGPGASGIDYLTIGGGAASFPNEVRDKFDIVSFDPRGVGQSAGVRCREELDSYYALDFEPDDDAERQALLAGNVELAQSCQRRNATLLPYVSTQRAARDLDRIRAALGERKLTYLGYSYGTYLGALYAAQFPKRVRALVLDGAVDPALSASDQQVQQAVGFERALELFLADCAARSSCAFYSRGRPDQAYDALRARVEVSPLPAERAGKGRKLHGTEFDIGMALLLYGGKNAWPQMARDLATAASGDGSALLFDSDQYTGRNEDGTYDHFQDAFYAIGCLDGPDVGGLDGLRAIEARAAIEAPRLGPSIVNASMPCAVWPVATRPAPLPRGTGAPPILVLSTTDDPATPLAWAQGLSTELESATLVTVEGSHHTAFGRSNRCIDELTTRYLVDLTVPAVGKEC